MFSGLFERFLEERSEGADSGLILPKDKAASFCRALMPDGRSSNDLLGVKIWFMFFDPLKPLFLKGLRPFYVFCPIYAGFGGGGRSRHCAIAADGGAGIFGCVRGCLRGPRWHRRMWRKALVRRRRRAASRATSPCRRRLASLVAPAPGVRWRAAFRRRVRGAKRARPAGEIQGVGKRGDVVERAAEVADEGLVGGGGVGCFSLLLIHLMRRTPCRGGARRRRRFGHLRPARSGAGKRCAGRYARRWLPTG